LQAGQKLKQEKEKANDPIGPTSSARNEVDEEGVPPAVVDGLDDSDNLDDAATSGSSASPDSSNPNSFSNTTIKNTMEGAVRKQFLRRPVKN